MEVTISIRNECFTEWSDDLEYFREKLHSALAIPSYTDQYSLLQSAAQIIRDHK